jgi:REP element-mobilizing transposase RayT
MPVWGIIENALVPFFITIMDPMEDFRISIHLHIVFSTKNQEPIVAEHVCRDIWAFLGDTAREHRIKVHCIGGALDHVHLFLAPPTTLSVAEIVHLMKENSAQWVRENYPAIPHFAWQEGDLTVSVSESEIPTLTAYINDQAHHHRHATFQQEYVALLKEYGIAYDPDDLWS